MKGRAAVYSAACEVCGLELPIRVSGRLGALRRLEVAWSRLAHTIRAHMARAHKQHIELADARKLMRPQFHGYEAW